MPLNLNEFAAVRGVDEGLLVRIVLTAHIRHAEQHVDAGTSLWAEPEMALELASDGRARIDWAGPLKTKTKPDPSWRPAPPQRHGLWTDAELTAAAKA